MMNSASPAYLGKTVLKKHSGAALVESVIILSLMVMLLVAIPSIAKRQDIRQTAVDANRYTTWEMTVSSSIDRELVIDRFFKQPDAAIRSAQTQLDDNHFWENQNNPQVREHAFHAAVGQGNVNANAQNALVDPQSIQVDVLERAASAGLVSDTITGTVRTVSDWTGGADAIAPDRGIVQTQLSVGINSRNLDATNTRSVPCTAGSTATPDCVSVNTAILVDGWEAANDADTEEGALTMVPSKLLKPLGKAFDALSVVPLLKEFEDMDDNFGCVNTSLLPTKELTGNLASDVGTPNDC